MKTKIIFLMTLCFSVIAANAQTEAVKVPAEVKPFVESGTKPIALESADLNGDNLKDYILVLERENPTEMDEYDFPKNQRPLLILVRGTDKKLSEAKRNEKMVMCSQCGGMFGDPFAGLTVGKNTFTVNHYGGSAWRWTADYKFNYSRIDKTWQLVRIEKTSYHNVRPMEETLEKTVLTPPKDFGKVDIADFDPADYEEKEDESEPTGRNFDQNLPQFINISANRFVNVKFSSVYTDLSKGCKSEGGDDGGHVGTTCKGVGNYQVYYFDSAANLNFSVENKKDKSDSISLGMQLLSYDTKKRKIEWRLADRKPFAVIIRMNKFETNDEGMPGKITGEYLLVKGLKGFENIDAEVDAKTQNANVEARNIADRGFNND